HQPEIKKITTEKGEVTYLNSGDWIENLTSLEYNLGQWKIYRYADDLYAKSIKLSKRFENKLDSDEIFKDLVNEFMTRK
ncbi:MAG TPA: UDP-2,3-diacylglucosamine diphosphatase, partial [Cyclobacteriaceae bacterium]|nr:UDP-2,3-diacylglucosamine diphosphatase [Cyclobacteriaceae bacterium]